MGFLSVQPLFHRPFVLPALVSFHAAVIPQPEVVLAADDPRRDLLRIESLDDGIFFLLGISSAIRDLLLSTGKPPTGKRAYHQTPAPKPGTRAALLRDLAPRCVRPRLHF